MMGRMLGRATAWLASAAAVISLIVVAPQLLKLIQGSPGPAEPAPAARSPNISVQGDNNTTISGSNNEVEINDDRAARRASEISAAQGLLSSFCDEVEAWVTNPQPHNRGMYSMNVPTPLQASKDDLIGVYGLEGLRALRETFSPVTRGLRDLSQLYLAQDLGTIDAAEAQEIRALKEEVLDSLDTACAQALTMSPKD